MALKAPAGIITLLIIAALAMTVACAAPPAPTPTPVQGVVIPYPEETEGKQYRMSEVCQHLQDQGYNVKGTMTHQFEPEDFKELLEKIPALARKPVENYIRDGVIVQIEINSLCKTLNN